jgi:cobalt/nickel transport system permease protein
MHMANELLRPGVAAGCMAVSAGVLALAAWRTQRGMDSSHGGVDSSPRGIDSSRVPLMGVLGAFVFAAQMINFPVLPGTSGHLVGAVLLALLLGPHAATLVMASIIIVQCLIFQDGGLLALGANILNMGIVPCYLGYGLFQVLAGSAPGRRRAYAAVFSASLVGLVAGAALVPVETHLSGALAVPLSRFLLAMIGLHLLVGLVEGLITFGVIAYVVRIRPDALDPRLARLRQGDARLGPRAVAWSMLVVALLLAGVGSLFASRWPDALDSITSLQERPATAMVRENADSTVARVSAAQSKAPLAEYQVRGLSEGWGTSISGLVGTVLTLGVVWGVGRALRRRSARPEQPTPHTH